MRRQYFQSLEHHSIFRTVRESILVNGRGWFVCSKCDSIGWSFNPNQEDLPSLSFLWTIIIPILWFHAINRLASTRIFKKECEGI